MDGNIDKAREALEVAKMWIPDDCCDDIRKLNDGIAAISAIDPEAWIKREKGGEWKEKPDFPWNDSEAIKMDGNIDKVLDEFDTSKYLYDPNTGVITKNGKGCGAITKKGYLRIQNDGKRIMAHRLAWFLYFKSWPSGYLDHINGDRLDNRISNLRVSSPRLNGLNKSIHRDGRLSGYSKQPNGKYRAEISFSGKKYSLGNYFTVAEAHAVYEDALGKVLAGKNPISAEPAPCRGNECESFDCEICDSRKKPAQDDGKPESDGKLESEAIRDERLATKQLLGAGCHDECGDLPEEDK